MSDLIPGGNYLSRLPTDFQTYIHLGHYARWRDDVQRREFWPETVQRYFDFFVPFLHEQHNLQIDFGEVEWLKHGIETLKTMPSMRCLMTAGPALSRDHTAGFNCSYLPIDNVRAFDEMIFILMCGCGLGFSVERQFISKLPTVPETFEKSTTVIQVRDSKRGWAEAYRELIAMLYAGRVPQWDITRVRAAGARLKTMGGRASGPAPLVDLFEFTIRIFENAKGRKLTSIECHDIACKIGDCVVMGGVRRSALISLSNLSDLRMRDAKSGNWYETAPHRMLANNSVAYTERPEVGQWMAEWLSLYNSKSGERGVFNREAAIKKALSIGRRIHWDEDKEHLIEFGLNPCGEIILRPQQFCNLTEPVARAEDTIEDLAEKVQMGTIFGTWQSCLTKFRYLRKQWQKNTEEERLLGVSITGIMDSPLLNGRKGRHQTEEAFEYLKAVAVKTNQEWAARLGINPSAAITCVKPSGTVSQLVGSPAGIHSRYAHQYIRRVRIDTKDPLFRFMKDLGFPNEPDVMKPDHMAVFSFPVRAPEKSITRNDRMAVQELEHWKLVRDHWCHHNPSVTINVREKEWPGVGSWVWDNFDSAAGMAFLPHSDHIYKQAPYEEVSEADLSRLEAAMPKDVDWSKLADYEKDDNTTGSQELACVGGACEIP